MKEVAPYRNEALLAQGHHPEPMIPEPILEKWQKIVNLMAEMVDVPAGVITRILGEDLQVFVSSSTKGNPFHFGDSQRLCGSGLYCEAVVTKNHGGRATECDLASGSHPLGYPGAAGW